MRTTPYEIRRIWKGILENLYADPDKTTKTIKLQDVSKMFLRHYGKLEADSLYSPTVPPMASINPAEKP